jgi:hypothetical protein
MSDIRNAAFKTLGTFRLALPCDQSGWQCSSIASDRERLFLCPVTSAYSRVCHEHRVMTLYTQVRTKSLYAVLCQIATLQFLAAAQALLRTYSTGPT